MIHTCTEVSYLCTDTDVLCTAACKGLLSHIGSKPGPRKREQIRKRQKRGKVDKTEQHGRALIVVQSSDPERNNTKTEMNHTSCRIYNIRYMYRYGCFTQEYLNAKYFVHKYLCLRLSCSCQRRQQVCDTKYFEVLRNSYKRYEFQKNTHGYYRNSCCA